MNKTFNLTSEEKDRIIEMAWEDRTPFDAIEAQFGVREAQVIQLMRLAIKNSSFKNWRARVQGRKTKHAKTAADGISTFRSNRQRNISMNKISKR